VELARTRDGNALDGRTSALDEGQARCGGARSTLRRRTSSPRMPRASSPRAMARRAGPLGTCEGSAEALCTVIASRIILRRYQGTDSDSSAPAPPPAAPCVQMFIWPNPWSCCRSSADRRRPARRWLEDTHEPAATTGDESRGRVGPRLAEAPCRSRSPSKASSTTPWVRPGTRAELPRPFRCLGLSIRRALWIEQGRAIDPLGSEVAGAAVRPSAKRLRQRCLRASVRPGQPSANSSPYPELESK